MKCPKCQTDNPETKQFCGDCGTQLISPSKDIHVEFTETLQTPIQELSTGSTFAGRYQIIEELGHGGMGRVYKVFDTDIKEKIALKLLRPEIALDKETVERFSNELKLARKISHRNVCRMYDLGREAGNYFITMEYVSGEDLKSFIRRSRQLVVGTAIFIAKQVCEGLAEAHRLGVVHRDLKPGNIMIDKEGNAKIMDFGIARSISVKGITGAGVMIGTPEYMSPEQVEGKEVDQRSDIYSLGIILYEMLTGQVPFEGDTPFTIGVKQKSEIPKDPRELNAQILQDLSRLILKCLEKDKERRYQNADELRANLEKIEKGIPTTERVVPEKKPLTSRELTIKFSLKRALIPALVIVGVTITALVIWKLIPQKEAAPVPKIENSVAVISFENQTGDKSYDYLQKAIPNLLITSLEQTSLHYVATWERLHDLLKQMGREDSEILDRDLGFELCRREGIEAIVLGSFVKAGGVFATDVKVLDVETKKLLMSAGSKGKGVDSILESQIDQLTREISQGIGHSMISTEAAQTRIANVTTSSIEAYNYFLRGKEDYYKWYWDNARQFLIKAVELDPTFAIAHLWLGILYDSLSDTKARNEEFGKAKKFSEKATEKERLYIQTVHAKYIEADPDKYLTMITQLIQKYPKEKEYHLGLGDYYRARDWKKAIEEIQKALELDPHFGFALNSLAHVYRQTGDYEKALELFRKFSTVSPGDAGPFDSMAWTYVTMGDLDEALAKFKEALEVKPDFFWSLKGIQYLYALKQDYPEAMRWIDQLISVAKSPGLIIEGYWCRALLDFWLGHFKRALSNLQEAEGRAKEIANEDAKAFTDFIKGCIYHERGELGLSRTYIQRCLDYETKQYPRPTSWLGAIYRFELGLVDLEQGRFDSAKSRLADIESFLANMDTYDKKWVAFFHDFLSAEILLREGSAKKSVGIFELTLQLRPPTPDFFRTDHLIAYNFPPLQDVLARAYQQNGQIDEAVAEYERLITVGPKNPSRALIHPLYYYRLANLYGQKGMKVQAKAQYMRFLDLWKDADPGTPEVEEAKKRVAAIQ